MQIVDPNTRSKTLSLLAASLAKVGEEPQSRRIFGDAQHSAAQIVDVTTRSKAFGVVAGSLAKAGKFRAARQMAQRCEPIDILNSYGTILQELAIR